MASLAVVVFRNGKMLPNATVRLKGPAGTKELPTNAVGNVLFMGLLPGVYIVNVAKGSDFLGVGSMTLKASQSGVIIIKYPRRAAAQANSQTGSLKVSVVGGSAPISGALVVISGPASRRATTSYQSLDGTSVVFRRLPPGNYSVSASVVFAGGALKRNSKSVKVLPGGFAMTTVRVFSPPPVPPPRPPYAHKSIESLNQEIDKLENELKSVDEKLGRLEGLDEIEDRHYLSQPWKPLSGGAQDGEAVNLLMRQERRYGRGKQIEKLWSEQRTLEDKLEALNEAFKYKWNYDL